MSSTSSVAQFMALMSGIQTPSTLRAGQVPSGENQENIGVFQQILSGTQLNIVNGQTTSPQSLTQNAIQGAESALPSVLPVPNEEASPSSIWQFIARNGANDGAQSNLIALNLAQRGVSDEIIQKITATFTTEELGEILQDPLLSAELNTTISKVTTASVDGDVDLDEAVETIVSAVQSLLLKKQDTIGELTFKPSDITDDIVSDIITNDPTQKTDEELVVLSVETPVILQTPIQVAQSPEATTFATQNAPEIARGANPFMSNMSKPEQATSPDVKNRPEHALQNTSANNKPDYQSIADRVNAQASLHANNNAAFNAETFNAIIPGGGQSEFLTDGESVIPFEAGFKTITQASNTLLTNASAGQPHPATHTVALSLTKFAQAGKAGETDRYRLQLDPPEMGRLDIEMEFLDSGKVKTVIMVDKPETLGLLQKDMHTLIKAMQDAGFENMSQNDLSFNLSQDNNTGDHANNNGHSNRGGSSSEMIESDLHILESEMSVIIDPETGQKHVNMLV